MEYKAPYRFSTPRSKKTADFFVYSLLGLVVGTAGGVFLGIIVCILATLTTPRFGYRVRLEGLPFFIPFAFCVLLVLLFALREWWRRHGLSILVDAQGVILNGRLLPWADIEGVAWSDRLAGMYARLEMKLTNGSLERIHLFTQEAAPLKLALERFRPPRP
ncbi:MAG: hypothetical protein HYY16_14620 [Planctomycetes bacterium]|nr:hypothetical protein [Planctomycetota bacterium]